MSRTVPSQIVSLIDELAFDINHPQIPVNYSTVGTLTGMARLVDEIPTELLTISGTDYNNLVSGVEVIKNMAARWHQSTGSAGLTHSGINGKNAVLLIREALAKCPDQSPSPSTSGLIFITDQDLRDSIRVDMSTATSALHNGEYKAATVLAGAVAEALLLWAVVNAPNAPSGKPEEWSLGKLIDEAKARSLITDSTFKQAKLAQNFRNLIHPGRAQRTKETCNRATALTAIAAVEHIANDLTP